jgi:Protein of unknown function (DUF1565)
MKSTAWVPGSLRISPLALALVALAMSCSAPNAAAAGLSHYVSTSGNDNNPGTFGSPWRTIQHAANTIAAGDTVFVRAGVYKEHVNVPVSGNATAGYTTFQNYPGETATVDGTGLDVPTGQYGLFNINGQSYLIISGFEIRNYKTSSTKYVPVGIYIYGAGSNLQILNNHIHNIQTSAKGCNANALGIAVYGTQAPASINNLTISGNEIDHLKTGCSETISMDGNVQNFVVTHNLIHDNNNIGIDAIGFEGVAPKGSLCGADPCDRARDGLIAENTVYKITSYGNPAYGNQYAADGIYVDGGTRIIIERNRIYQVDLGIEMASEHSGKTTDNIIARNNLIYFGNSAGISIGGYASGVGGSDSCTIVNNSLLYNDRKNTGSGEFQIQFHATNNVFKNNVAYATKQGLLINNFTKSEPNPADVDFNVYNSSVGAANATFLWNGKTYTGFAAYRSGTGNDPDSFFADPLYVSLTMPDLRVAATSPAVNAGINLGSTIVGTVDFAGNPRVQGSNIDIGAYEQ